jgi:hypothetical protein
VTRSGVRSEERGERSEERGERSEERGARREAADPRGASFESATAGDDTRVLPSQRARSIRREA